MLILTRHAGQNIVIDDNVVVRVLKIGGNEITLGIEAPREIAVNREEVYNRIKAAEAAEAEAEGQE